MELIRYLNAVFFDEQQLLSAAGIARDELAAIQQRGVMPRASYTLQLQVDCDSFFGPHQAQPAIAYYAKGYADWIDASRELAQDEAFAVFSQRYKAQLQRLNDAGIATTHGKLNASLDAHLESEWRYFLDGTYGLCTQSGLPEDIAAKELAVVMIKEITDERYDKPLSADESARLATAVDLLDAVSAQFAPHERPRSSRYRLIDQMRAAYRI